MNAVISTRSSGSDKPNGARTNETDVSAAAIVGALIEGLIGPFAPADAGDPAGNRAQVQMLSLLALRALGVVDARARGLVVQAVLPDAES